MPDTNNTQHGGAAPGQPSGRGKHWTVLVVDSSSAARSVIGPIVDEMDCAVHFAKSRDEALELLTNRAIDAAIVNATLADGSGLDVLDALRARDLTSSVIVTSSDATVDLTVESVRRGACDFLAAPMDRDALAERLGAALERVTSERKRDRKIKRLRSICRRLNDARHEVSQQVDELCTDLVSAYQELSDQFGHVSLASEFAVEVRQELDIESLLRTVLEAMLARTGPTNAAVFLPTGHSDYNLGAYVNQTLSAETADVLLDHLADIVPSEYDEEETIVRLNDDTERWQWICEEADWLEGMDSVAFSCTHEGECMAVVMLFRDEAQPFEDIVLEQLAVMRDLFAEQLDRVVRVHHRALPELPSKGFEIGPEEDDDDGTDFGDPFGNSGGMAA